MSRLTKAFCLMSLCLLAPTLTVASGVHPLFDVQSTTGSPFPTDRFTLKDSAQNTDRRVNLPMPNCVASPSNCGDVALLNQLDGFNIEPRISIPFNGAIDPSTVNNNTVFLIRIADTSNPTTFNPQIVGINQVVWDTLTNTLFVKSEQQLDQHTTYLLIVTKGALCHLHANAVLCRRSLILATYHLAQEKVLCKPERSLTHPKHTAHWLSGENWAPNSSATRTNL